MRNIFVLDSSVFNKLFLNEQDRHLAIDFIRNSEDRKFLAPQLFVYEVISVALSRGVDAEVVYTMLYEQQIANLEVVSMSRVLFEEAAKIVKSGSAKTGFVSFYDAVYHALAITNNCNFITADKKYYDKTKKFGHVKMLSGACVK